MNQLSIPFNKKRVSLGNQRARYNSYVDHLRKKFYINSMRNSQDVPQWMSRTQSHYHKDKTLQSSKFERPTASFHAITRKNIYQNQPQVSNLSGQFQQIPNKKIRNKWELKNHSFEFDWPQTQRKVDKKIQSNYKLDQLNKTTLFGSENIQKNRRQNYFRFELPKYGIKQSPLHRQKQTPVKIGHSAMIDSIVTQ